MSETSPPTPKPGWYPDASGGQRWWDGTQWTEHRAPAVAQAQPLIHVPGRMPGFVCGLIGFIFVAIPIVAIPLGIVGWVESTKALRLSRDATRGRGLAVAGLVLSIASVAISALFVLLAIPGAIQANFNQ